jgi:hypothetical protein
MEKYQERLVFPSEMQSGDVTMAQGFLPERLFTNFDNWQEILDEATIFLLHGSFISLALAASIQK